MWLEALDHDERRQLISIAEDVADVGGDRTPEQINALQSLKKTLLN